MAVLLLSAVRLAIIVVLVIAVVHCFGPNCLVAFATIEY